MRQEPQVIISLVEAVSLIKDAFREQTALMILNHSNKIHRLQNTLDYNCCPYFELLLKEMFENTEKTLPYGELAPSTALLIQDGLDKETAKLLSNRVFQTTVDALSGMMPNLNFGDADGYGYGMCGEYDVMVMPPIRHD